MALYFPFLLSLLILLLHLSAALSSPPPPTTSSQSLSPPSPPPSLSPPPPSSPTQRRRQPQRQRRRSRPRQQSQSTAAAPPPQSPLPREPATSQQFNNIIDALIGSGDFSNWVSIISSAIIPLSATLFVPQNEAVNPPIIAGAGTGDPFMFPYHVVPQRLSFSDLELFRTNTRLPTLLPGKSIIITNNSRLNFTIDGSKILQPDIYSTATVIIHGVSTVFDYSVYGDGLDFLPEPEPRKPQPEPNQTQVFRPPRQPPRPVNFPKGEISGLSSDAAPPCLCIEFPVIFLVFCGVLMFKIQRNGHGRW